jgi:hypothetical protein
MARAPAAPEPDLPQPSRLWTAAEANRRLPQLEELLPRLKTWALRLAEVHAEIARLTAFWGPEVDAPDHVDHERKSQLDLEEHHLHQRLEEAVAALRRDGIEVKDLEHGLVDFYGLVGGELVFLCWQAPETDVAFFHPLDSGFRGRRPLPAHLRAAPAGARDGA